jgi:4-hydroxy-3-polyprenylbenzoate decarboxylase
LPGVIALRTGSFQNYPQANAEMETLNSQLVSHIAQLEGIVQIIICDDTAFVAANINNYVWVTYTRSNPSHDIYGVAAFTENKHWGCNGPMVIDARAKPHHAPVLEKDPEVEKKIDRLFEKGGSLYAVLK